jgi:hypothetical protein
MTATKSAGETKSSAAVKIVKMGRIALISAVGTAFAWCSVGLAHADSVSNGVPYTVVPDLLAGGSPNGLGNWTVQYQRIAGGDPEITDAINGILEDEARGQGWLYVASASKTNHWTFHTTGTLDFRPVTISEVFLGEYDTDLPNMPFQTVATRVFDARSGIQIVWENLFRDERDGLARLSALTKAILPTAYPPPPGGWGQYSAGMAPVDTNFKYWVPTTAGVELHFPDYQFGRGLHTITIPWAQVSDLFAPEFLPIIE